MRSKHENVNSMTSKGMYFWPDDIILSTLFYRFYPGGLFTFQRPFENCYEKPSDLSQSYLIWCECIKKRDSPRSISIWGSSLVLQLSVTSELLIFRGTPQCCTNDIHGMCGWLHSCVCVRMRDGAFRECLTFSQRAGFTQRRCHTSPIQLIAGQRGFCQTDRCSSLTFVLLNICSQKIRRASLSATDSQPTPLRSDLLKNLPFVYVFIKEQ